MLIVPAFNKILHPLFSTVFHIILPFEVFVLYREEAAINQLITLSKDTRAGGSAEGAHIHIVHLSDARTSLNLIKVAKHSLTFWFLLFIHFILSICCLCTPFTLCGGLLLLRIGNSSS